MSAIPEDEDEITTYQTSASNAAAASEEANLFADEDDFHSLNASLRFNYLVSGPDRPSLYLFGGGGLMYVSFDDDDSETNPTAGGGLGFRQPIRSAGSFRVEAGYERMFGDEGGDADIFKLSFGFALRF